jgi:hypothetical protein
MDQGRLVKELKALTNVVRVLCRWSPEDSHTSKIKAEREPSIRS